MGKEFNIHYIDHEVLVFCPAILFVTLQIYFSDNVSYVVLAENLMLSVQNIILKVDHLKLIRKMNLNKLVVAHLNINSIRD